MWVQSINIQLNFDYTITQDLKVKSRYVKIKDQRLKLTISVPISRCTSQVHVCKPFFCFLNSPSNSVKSTSHKIVECVLKETVTVAVTVADWVHRYIT